MANSVWKKTSFVRDYYMKAYKSDELGKEINPQLTFSQAFNGMKKGDKQCLPPFLLLVC